VLVEREASNAPLASIRAALRVRQCCRKNRMPHQCSARAPFIRAMKQEGHNTHKRLISDSSVERVERTVNLLLSPRWRGQKGAGGSVAAPNFSKSGGIRRNQAQRLLVRANMCVFKTIECVSSSTTKRDSVSHPRMQT
jgi:hypothetical protein